MDYFQRKHFAILCNYVCGDIACYYSSLYNFSKKVCFSLVFAWGKSFSALFIYFPALICTIIVTYQCLFWKCNLMTHF